MTFIPEKSWKNKKLYPKEYNLYKTLSNQKLISFIYKNILILNPFYLLNYFNILSYLNLSFFLNIFKLKLKKSVSN